MRWYRLSLSVVRRTELEQVVYVTAHSKGPKMHLVECISVDSTGISIYLYKAEVRWYRLSLSVVRRTELEQVVYVTAHSKGPKMHLVDCVSVDSTRYKCRCLYKAEVRRYRLSLSVLRRTWLYQVVYNSIEQVRLISKELKCIR